MSDRARLESLAAVLGHEAAGPLLAAFSSAAGAKGDLDPEGHWVTITGQHVHIDGQGQIDAGGHPELRKVLAEKAGLHARGEGQKAAGPPGYPAGVASVLGEFHGLAATDKREHQAIFDAKTGELIHRDVGKAFGESSEQVNPHVVLPSHLLLGGRPFHQVHTHPGGGPPSDGDWATLGWGNVASVTMAGPDESYIITHTGGKRATPAALKDAWNEIQQRLEAAGGLDDVHGMMHRVSLEMAARFPQYRLEVAKKGEAPVAPELPPPSYDLKATPDEAWAWAKGQGAPVLPEKPEEAAGLIVDHLMGSEAFKRLQEKFGEKPEPEKIRDNWLKLLRAKKGNESGTPALKGLEPQKVLAVQNAINDNHVNPAFRAVTEKHGQVPVILRQAEKGYQAAAEYRGVIHVFHGKWMNDQVRSSPDKPPEPGDAIAGGWGGLAAELRHEYGHFLHDKLGHEKAKAFTDTLPDTETIRKGLTSYAGKNREEAFCELFALVTDRHYEPARFPPWVRDAGERLLKLVQA